MLEAAAAPGESSRCGVESLRRVDTISPRAKPQLLIYENRSPHLVHRTTTRRPSLMLRQPKVRLTMIPSLKPTTAPFYTIGNVQSGGTFWRACAPFKAWWLIDRRIRPALPCPA
jgi:hypothetical protein